MLGPVNGQGFSVDEGLVMEYLGLIPFTVLLVSGYLLGLIRVRKSFFFFLMSFLEEKILEPNSLF